MKTTTVEHFQTGGADATLRAVSSSLLSIPVFVTVVVLGFLFALVLRWLPATGWTPLLEDPVQNLRHVALPVMCLAVHQTAYFYRVSRSQFVSTLQEEYVLAARGLGANSWRILIREILPNLLPAMFSVAFTGLAILLVAEGGLAFLGFSVQLPFPTWGYMINEARPDLTKGAGWAVFFPCMMLFLTVLSFNVIGDRVARRFDIREATL